MAITRRRLGRPTFCVLPLLLASPASAAQPDEPTFHEHWHDGRAELDGYRWTVQRYGQSRAGRVVMIFVTEPFSESKRVKLDDPSGAPGDAVDVLKLNLVRDFQTGIYDYNTMTSVFARSSDFAPLKISFSSAEWCGHVYEELLPDRDRIRTRIFSYFEGESTHGELDRRAGGVSGDNLFILLRGLRGPYLEPGETRTVAFLPGALHRRLRHRPLAWTTAEIERDPEVRTTTVPAGAFATDAYRVTTADGRLGRFFIERDHPHRIVAWSWGRDPDAAKTRSGALTESGELTGTIRVKYWQLHDEGDERYLKELGLPLSAAGPGKKPDGAVSAGQP